MRAHPGEGSLKNSCGKTLIILALLWLLVNKKFSQNLIYFSFSKYSL